jgi:predicted GNAT superfamily acetyltransferase
VSNTPDILAIERDHQPAVLALNNQHAVELSWLEPGQLEHLLRQAFHARRIGEVDAFLLAMDERADYDSPNYRWFRQRYQRFVYIDRIVVAPMGRGRGYARQLYGDVFRQAAEAGYECVVCEVNSEPPNPASDAFHAALGFVEVGAATIHGGSKRVRYLSRSVGAAVLSDDRVVMRAAEDS